MARVTRLGTEPHMQPLVFVIGDMLDELQERPVPDAGLPEALALGDVWVPLMSEGLLHGFLRASKPPESA